MSCLCVIRTKLLTMHSLRFAPQWNVRQIQSGSTISKNVWDGKLIDKIQGKLPEIVLFEEREEGCIFGNLNEGKNTLMFKGETPLAAVEDLREMLKLVELPVQERITPKINALANLITHHILKEES